MIVFLLACSNSTSDEKINLSNDKSSVNVNIAPIYDEDLVCLDNNGDNGCRICESISLESIDIVGEWVLSNRFVNLMPAGIEGCACISSGLKGTYFAHMLIGENGYFYGRPSIDYSSIWEGCVIESEGELNLMLSRCPGEFHCPSDEEMGGVPKIGAIYKHNNSLIVKSQIVSGELDEPLDECSGCYSFSSTEIEQFQLNNVELFYTRREF